MVVWDDSGERAELSKGNNTNIELKKNNQNRVYKYLYYQEGSTLKEIADDLNMSMPTVIRIVKELKEEQLVQEGGSLESTGGRRAKILTCNSRVRYSIGVDITKNHIAFLIIDIRGEILKSSRLRFPFRNTDEYFEKFFEYFNQFLQETGVPGEKILGVGISIPGILSHDNRYMRFGGVIDFIGGDLYRFSEKIPFPCCFCNDANAGGYAEMWKKEKVDKAVYLSLSNSVGGAILLGGSIYYGDNQKSAEFGHMTIINDGKLCYCGRKGCLDAYCSAGVLEKDGMSLEEFFFWLKSGDSQCRELWETYKYYLILAISNLRTCFDCQVILGGYVGSYLEDYLDEIQKSLEPYCLFEKNTDFVKVCYYKREAAAVGAALMHVKEFIEEV